MNKTCDKAVCIMKRIFVILAVLCLLFTLTACRGKHISYDNQEKVAKYVTGNLKVLYSEKETEFFVYEVKSGVRYGYYYTAENEVIWPEGFSGDTTKSKKAHGGRYFGKVGGEDEWCFIKEITDNWYYYEWHY